MKKILIICVVGILSMLMLIACPTPENNADNKNKNNGTDDGTPDIDIALIQTPIWEDDSEKDCADSADIITGNGTKITMLFEPDGSFYYPSFADIVDELGGVNCTTNKNDPVTGIGTLTRAQIKTISAPTTTGIDSYTGTYTLSGNTITATLADNTILTMTYDSASGITVNNKKGIEKRALVGRIFTILDAGFTGSN